MKRFWKGASIAPEGDCWSVQLDGKPVRVPGNGALRLPSRALAEAVAGEWQAAGGTAGGETTRGEIGPEDLPLTRLAGTAQERIAPDPAPVVAELARYAGSDMLCYRAAGPEALARREDEGWQPWLDWAARTYGARLRVTTGVVHVTQPAEALAALHEAVSVQSVPALAALGVAVPALGSLVLGLAMADGALAADRAYHLAALDEAFQAELWGEDAEASARQARIRQDIVLAGRFLELSRQ